MNKKFLIDKKYLKISIYAFVVLALLIILDKAVGNFMSFSAAAAKIGSAFIAVVSPFLCGFFIAFFLNPIVRLIENKILLKSAYFSKHQSLARTLSILIAFTLVIGLIVWIILYFVPELYESVNSFILNFNQNITSLQNFYRNFFDQIEAIDSADVLKILNSVYDYFLGHEIDIPEMTTIVLERTMQTVSFLVNIFVGTFIAFYMLADKERFSGRIKKTLHVIFGKEKAEKIVYNSGRIQNIFEVFIIGKTIDSSIIGLLCFIVMTILNLPYKGIISLIVGVTNMIPYFGPFIGYIPSTLIMLLSYPTKAGITLLALIIIQIFDGNYLGPKILGASTGLSPVLVIFSIVIGGAVAGPLGMFLGVPILASIRLFFAEFIDSKYENIKNPKPSSEEEDSEQDISDYD